MGERHIGSKDNPFEDLEVPTVTRAAVRPATRLDLFGSLGALVLLMAFHAVQVSQWTRHDRRTPGWDQAVQLETAIDLRDGLAARDLGAAFVQRPKPGMPPFPPLYHLSIQGALAAADPVNSALWVNWGYLCLLCVAVWGLGRHFLGPWQGLGAAVLLTCAPEVSWLMRETLVDVALTAWTACAYWAYAACDGFRRRGPSVLFGALFGAAMMTKWSAFSYFLPVLAPAFSALTRGPSGGLFAAAGTAAVVAGPWYLAQLPVLVPRLFEAAADQAVPVWKGGAAFSYLFQMSEGLELPLFLLGLVGAAVPSMRRRTQDAWLLPAFFLTSLVFWTVVPNRQLRYLLPGLVPMAVLAMGPWPRGLREAACAVALVSAWNYPRGDLPRLWLNPGFPISVLKSDKPAADVWPLGDILKAAQAMREPGTPLSNLAFVANHPRLNGPNLNWEVKRLGLKGLKIRGVTKRYTELCEFVLVKTGDLGPASVTGQLPEVQKVMLDPGRWWQRGWAEKRRWPLPDGTEAVLFQRRHPAAAPAGEGRLRFDYYEDGSFKAEGLEIDLGRWDPALGVYPRASVRAAHVALRGLELDNVELGMTNLSLFPSDESRQAKADPLADPRFTRLDGLELRRAELTQEALAAFLDARVKGLESAKVAMAKGRVSAEALYKGHRVSLKLSPRLLEGGAGLDAGVESAEFELVPLPTRLLGAGRLRLPFAPSSELPFRISVKSLSVDDGVLRVGE